MAKKPSRYVRVSLAHWAFIEGGEVEPAIRIQGSAAFTMIPFDRARNIIDAAHDLCDEHEANLRAAQEGGDEHERDLRKRAEDLADYRLTMIQRRDQTIDALRARMSGMEKS